MDTVLRSAGFISLRSWMDDLTYTLDADHLIRLRTNLGSAKPRFDGLDAKARTACVAEARRRMEELGSEDFVARGAVVYAVACA